jgi:enoyl-CoA hydratase
MSLWRSDKPTVVKIHGVAVGGGSDMALCCDLTFMAEDARIGYPPSRVWGCPTTAMWAYRVGAERAKRIHFSGELVRGTDAAAMGLVGEAIPAAELDAVVDKTIARIVTVPTNQLFFHKQVVNQAIEQMGLFNTQRLATIFDGMSRHSPEGIAFQQRTMEVGFKQAVKERDSGEETEWSNMLDKNNKSKL